MKKPFKIVELSLSSPEMAEAFARLLHALAPDKPPPDPAVVLKSLDDALKSAETVMLIAVEADAGWEDGTVGMVTVTIQRKPSGRQAVISDMAVLPVCRRMGIGTMLLERAIVVAKRATAISIELTTNPSRAEAIKLYEKFGFRERQSHIYHLDGT